MTLTFGSLFAGIGGIDLGLERAGMECRWQVEIDPYATRVLEKHWPNVRRYSDVRTVGAADLDPVDVLAGGFPCQDISHAGKRAGIGGGQSGLWSEYARLVGELRPRYVLVENVAALLGRGINVVLGDLAALGFDAEWECLPAVAFGAPHIRDRVFILAYTASTRCEEGLREASGAVRLEAWRTEPQRRGTDVADAFRSRLEIGEGIRPDAEQKLPSTERSCSGTRDVAYANSAGPAHHQEADSWGERIPRGNAPAHSDWWRVEPHVGRVVDGPASRLERSIRIAQVQCLGNAVVPQIVEYIGRCIVAAETAR